MSLSDSSNRLSGSSGAKPFLGSIECLISLAGFATFLLLYWAQPLLPVLADEFKQGAASASLISAVSSAALSFGLIPASFLADRWGRKPILCSSLALASLLTLVMSLPLSLPSLISARLCLGLALSGIPAVGMTYLSEELDPRFLGRAMGLYVAGNACGGMSSRLLMSELYTLIDWHHILLFLGSISLLLSVLLYYLLPPSRNYVVPKLTFKAQAHSSLARLRQALSRLDLGVLYLVAFIIMGVFVSVYNFLEFRLSEAPFSLSIHQTALVFSSYLIGMFSSSFIGRCSDHFGRARMLRWMLLVLLAGLCLSAAARLSVIVVGVVMLTFGFFGAHATASAWVNINAGAHKSHASAFYLTFYYLGSSVLGSLSGLVWQAYHWPGVVLFLGTLCLLSLAALAHLESMGKSVSN